MITTRPINQPAAVTQAHSDAKGRLPWPASIFIVALIIPFFFQVGPLLLTMNRTILLIMVIPCIIKWMSGAAGRIRTADVALLLFWFWGALSLSVLHGPGAAIESAGIDFVETMGAYLMARCYIRDAASFRQMVKLFFWTVAVMLPFAIYETLTARNIMLDIANSIWFSGHDALKDARWGFDRVQGVFQHPILFGVYCGSILSLTYYVLGHGMSRFWRLFAFGVVGLTASLSLSSGPMAMILAQVLFIGWDQILISVRRRWQIMAGGVLSLIILIELVADRSPARIFIAYFAFNKTSAQNRLRIWDWGTLSVSNHPVFGIGRNEWVRAPWMENSIDMFWLVPAVRSGLPAGLLLQLVLLSITLPMIFKRGLSDRLSIYRTGYLICIVGFYLCGWTVDFWKTVYVQFLFLLGSGVWLLDVKNSDGEPAPVVETPKDRRAPLPYARSFGATRSRHDGSVFRRGRDA